MNRPQISDVSGLVFVGYALIAVSALIAISAPPLAYLARGKTWAAVLLFILCVLAIIPTYAAVAGFVALIGEGFQWFQLLIALAWLIPGIAVWCSIHLWRLPSARA